MSDCNLDLIERDEDGNIKKVYQTDGQTESNLYNHMGKLPIELSEDDQTGMYANVISQEDGKNILRETETPEQKRKRREVWDESRGEQILEGAPKYKRSAGAIPELVSIAEEYAEKNGIDYKRQSKYVEVDVERAERIAEAYDNMKHDPSNPVVKEAYQNLIEQTKAQYDMLVDAGYQFYFFDKTNDPYDGKPVRAIVELREDRKMGSYSTEAGFGTSDELDVSDNPMLADTGLEWGFGSVDGQKKRVLANDLFRVVHDAFGHGLEGAGFRARGEENAWQAHARLFTGSAVGAITSETRGQNSWLNYGKYASQNQTASVDDTVFADQKTGLMPEWTWKEGYDEGVSLDESSSSDTRFRLSAQEESGMTEDREAMIDAIGQDMVDSLPEVELNMEIPSINRSVEVDSIGDSSVSNEDKQKALDKFNDLYSEKYWGGRRITFDDLTLTKEDLIKKFNGIKQLPGMSDILGTGMRKDAIGGDLYLQGGALYNFLGLDNQNLAWAGVFKEDAELATKRAVDIFKKNPEMFTKFWEENPQYYGLVPYSIMRMNNDAVQSNEAVFRWINPLLREGKGITKKGRVEAYKVVEEAIVKSKKAGFNAFLQKFKESGAPRTIDSFLDAVSEDSKDRASKDLRKYKGVLVENGHLTLDDKRVIFGLLFTKGGDSKVFKALKSGTKRDISGLKEFFTIDSVYKGVGEESVMKTERGDLIAIMGIDVINPEVLPASHDNYGWGSKGRLIGYLENPESGIDVFPEFYAKAPKVFKAAKDQTEDTRPDATGIINQVGGNFFNNLFFVNSEYKFGENPTDLEVLSAKMRAAFPGVNVFNTKEDFDRALAKEEQAGFLSKRMYNGKVISGMTKNGDIFINPDASLATPIHEFAHIWMDYLRSKVSGGKGTKLLNRGMYLVEGTQAYDKALETYGARDSSGKIIRDNLGNPINNDLVKEEALVELIATKGENIILGAKKKSEIKSWINAVFKTIKDFFADFKSKNDKSDVSVKILNNDFIKEMTLEEFKDTALSDLFNGNVIDSSFRGEVQGLEFTKDKDKNTYSYKPNGGSVTDTSPRFMIAGEKADLSQDIRDNLSVARQMESSNKTVKEIRLATGWERGADGKWRYEFQDIKLKDELKVGEYKLSDLIDESDEILNYYPELKNLEVVITPNIGGVSYGGKVEVGVNSGLKVLLHEIQHEIQKLEGFDGGGNAMNLAFAERMMKSISETKRFMSDKSQEFNSKKNKLDFYKKYAKSWEVSSSTLLDLINYESWDEWLKENDIDWFKSYKESLRNYTNKVGEVEARNVEKRRGMTPEQRRATTLQETEDVAREDQIYFENNQASYSLLTESEDNTPKNLNKVDFLTEDFTNTIYKVKGDNTEYTSYKDALNNLGSSKVIEVSLNDGNGNYMNVATVEGTTDPSTAQGFINKYIKEGVLQETKTDQGGFLPVESISGNTFVSEPILESDAIYHLGEGSFIKNDDGSYTIKDTTRDVVKVSNKKGEEVYTSFAELEKVGNFKELSKKVDDPAMVATLMVSRARKIKDARDTTRPNQAYDIDFTENDLTQALLDFLASMGVSVTSISDYVKNYNAKKGVDPSARALADIANRLIAFRDGVINIEDLTEETAHFIVEGWDQAEIQPLLDQVTSTKEWAEHSDYYRNVYKSKYPKELLEDAVKREVLGKILAKSLQNRFSELNDNSEANQENRSLLTKVLGLFTGFIQKINEFITPKHRDTIGDFTNKVEQLLMKKELEGNIDQNNFNNNKFVLYSVKPTGNPTLDNILLKSKDLVYNLAENVNTLKEVLATTRLDRNTARSIDKDLDRLIRETSDPEAYKLLEDSEKALLEAETLNGMSRALVLAENQSNYIKKAIESKGKLNQEESIVYQNLRNEIQPIVNALKNNIDSRKGEDYAVLKNQAEEIYSNIGDIGTVIDSIESDVIEELIQDVRDRFPNAGEEYENQIREWAQVAQRDSTKFHATFGQLMHSNDPLLGMMNYIIEDLNWEAKDDSMRNFKKFIQDLKENGIVDAKGLGEKITDYGKFLLSPYDFTAFQEDMRVGRLQILKDVLGLDESLDDIELMQKERDPKVTDLTREQDTIIKRRNTELNQSLTEQRYNKEFYEERNKRYIELDITSDTIDFINSLSASRSPLLAKASVEVDGVKTIDLTKLTEFEREQLIAISKNRSESKTLHEKSGELKKGLLVSSVRPSSDIDYIEQGGLFYTLDPTVDTVLGSTKIAWDLNRLDQEFFKPTFGYTVSSSAPTSPEAVYTKGKNGMYYVLDTTLTDSALSGSKLVYERSVVEPSEGNYVKDGKYYYKLTETKDRPNTKSKTFYKSLKESFDKNGIGGVKDFLMNNTSISFKDSYWDELLGGTPSIKNKFKTFVESDSDNVTIEDRKLLESILSNTTALKSILKMYKNPAVPTESLSDAIPSVIKSSIDSLEARIQSDYRQVRSRLDENNLLEEEEEEEKAPISENTLNSTVRKTFDGLKTEEQKLKYLESLLSKDNQLNLRNLRKALNTGIGESQFNAFFSTIDRANLSYNEILMEYSAYKLPSYYKRFAPVGYKQEFDVIETLDKNLNYKYQQVLDFIETASVIEINPNYSFNEDRAEQELNPDYDTNFEGGSVQPKLSKYRNKKFFELFGEKKDSEGNYVATKNKELFNTVEIFKNYQRKTLENINEEGTNIYRLPQMSKTNQEKFAGLFSEEGKLTDKIKEAYLDIAKYRADDLVQGQRVSGKQVIPKYYVNDVDGGVEDLSLDVLSTYYLMSKESSLYKARRKHIGKAVALQDKILKRQYKDGKVSSESNTASMVRSFMDSSFFGVKETVMYKKKILGYEVDVAKFARNILGAVKFRNLGLNAIIPATSYLTAETNTFIERLIGERVHKSSYNKAIPEFGRLAGEAMTETGKDYTESPLNVLGEFFGVFDAEDRLKNSVQGKFWKNLPKVGHMMHSMGNFPIIPRIMLSTLYDFRFTNDGKIMNFTEFKRMKLTEEGVSDKKAINQEWEALSDRNIYDHLDISKTDVTLNMGRVQQTLGSGVQVDQDYIDKKVIDIKKFVSRNVADIDGQIPSDKKIAAQRNFMLNFVMTHKSWLSIATSNRTKSRHFNTSTGLYEEGNYGSMVRVFGKIFSEVKEQGLTNVVNAMKTVWDNADEVERLSIRRTSVDFVAFSALGLLASVLMGYADEEENQDVWSLQLANLLMLRTLNETGGSTLGLHNSYFDTVKNVFVGLDLVKTGLSVNHYFDDKVITKGIYKGKTIRERQMIKLMPGAKQALDLSQLDVTTKTFLQFNEDNIAITPSLNYFLFDKDK